MQSIHIARTDCRMNDRARCQMAPRLNSESGNPVSPTPARQRQYAACQLPACTARATGAHCLPACCLPTACLRTHMTCVKCTSGAICAACAAGLRSERARW